MVFVEVIGAEVEAAEDWRNAQVLAVGEVHDGGRHVCISYSIPMLLLRLWCELSCIVLFLQLQCRR